MNSKLGLMDMGGILIETFKVYKKNFNRITIIVVIVQAPLYLLRYLLTLQIVPQGNLDLLSPVILTGIMLIVVDFAAATPLMSGALIHAVFEQTLGRKIDIGRAYRFVGKRWKALVGATIFFALAILGMSILFPLAVYYGIRWSFIWQAVILRGLSPRAALAHSSYLVGGNWWPVFGVVTILSILSIALWGILGIIPAIGNTAGFILSAPIVVIGRTLLYYSLRAKKERYGPGSLAAELDRMDYESDAHLPAGSA